MSHFTVMVIGKNPEKQLAPFDEKKRVPRYCYYTKKQLIEKEKKLIEDYKNGMYAEYLKDPEKYKEGCKNYPEHFIYISEKFPEKLKWTEKQIYEDAIKYCKPEEIGKKGEIYSDYNPKSKWDWYDLGGRWSGMLKLKKGVKDAEISENTQSVDQAKKGDIENFDEIITFALIKNGKWYEIGEMGWWNIASNEKDEKQWEAEFKKLVSSLPDDTLISIYDCHI